MTGNKLFHSTAWYASGNIVLRAANFLLLPVYSHFISPSDFGTLSLLIAVYAIASVVYQLGLPAALTKFYIEKNSDDKKIIFSTAFWFLLLFGSIFTFSLYFVSKDLSTWITGDSYNEFLIKLILIILLVESITAYAVQLLKTKEDAKKTVLISAVGAVFNIFITLLLLIGYKFGISAVLIAQLISAIIILIFTLFIVKGEIVLSFDKKIFSQMVKFSLPLMIGGILTACVDFVDRFFIDWYLTKEDVGLYSFAYRIAIVMNLFVISFRTAWTPRSIIEYNEGSYQKKFGKYFSALFSFLLLMFLTITLFAEYLFHIDTGSGNLFNQNYIGGLSILPYVMIGYLFNGLIAFYSLYPFVSGKGYHFLISDLIAFSVNIFFNYLLIPRYGFIGAAIATAFSFFCSFIYLFLISAKKIKFEYRISELGIVFTFAIVVYVFGSYTDSIGIRIFLLLIFATSVVRNLFRSEMIQFFKKD